jgi:hypothetical protein
MRLSGPIIEELINDAASVINPKIVGNRLFGDVGCALITRGGNVYLGVAETRLPAPVFEGSASTPLMA